MNILFSASLLRRWLLLFSLSSLSLFIFNFFYDLSCEISRVVNRSALIELCGLWQAMLPSFELRGSWDTRLSELLSSLKLS